MNFLYKGAHRRILAALVFVTSLFLSTQQIVWAAASSTVAGTTSTPSPSVAMTTINAPQFSPTDLAAITKPATVQIALHITGSVTVNPYIIDLKHLTVSAANTSAARANARDLNDQLTYLTASSGPMINEYGTGSGFVVNPNGYILTNAHVATLGEIKDQIASNIALEAFFGAEMSLPYSEQTLLSQNVSSQQAEDFGKKLKQFFFDNLTFNIKSTISVVTPAILSNVASTTFDALLKDGVPATVVTADQNFTKDDKDVALIKINKTNLPSIPLGDSSLVTQGDQVALFGYPASADISASVGAMATTSDDLGKGFLNPVFTVGRINAFKDSPNNSFTAFETDAKSSSGSSGSPVVAADGSVMGMVTWVSAPGLLSGSMGDSFTFVIPSNVIKSVVNSSAIDTTPSPYFTHFTKGIQLLNQLHGEQALAEFTQAENSGSDAQFPVKGAVAPYIARAQALISSGQSVDSWWGAVRHGFATANIGLWVFGLFGIAGFAILLIIILLIRRRMKKDEKEIEGIEQKLSTLQQGSMNDSHSSGQQQTPFGFVGQHTQATTVRENTSGMQGHNSQVHTTPVSVPPELAQYVQSQKAAGYDAQAIKAALKQGGWDDTEINQALA